MTGMQRRSLLVRVPALSAMDFVAAVESGMAARQVAAEERTKEAAEEAGGRADAAAGPQRPPAVRGRAAREAEERVPDRAEQEGPRETAVAAAGKAERLVAIEILIETEWWEPPGKAAAARAKIDAERAVEEPPAEAGEPPPAAEPPAAKQ